MNHKKAHVQEAISARGRLLQATLLNIRLKKKSIKCFISVGGVCGSIDLR